MMIHCGDTEILPEEAIFETLATFKSEGRVEPSARASMATRQL